MSSWLHCDESVDMLLSVVRALLVRAYFDWYVLCSSIGDEIQGGSLNCIIRWLFFLKGTIKIGFSFHSPSLSLIAAHSVPVFAPLLSFQQDKHSLAIWHTTTQRRSMNMQSQNKKNTSPNRTEQNLNTRWLTNKSSNSRESAVLIVFHNYSMNRLQVDS